MQSVSVETLGRFRALGLWICVSLMVLSHGRAQDPTTTPIITPECLPEEGIPISLGRYYVFYDQILEISPSPLMHLPGKIHSNGNLYVQAVNQANYQAAVTCAAQIRHGRAPLCNQTAHDADAMGQSWAGTTDGASIFDGQGSINFTFDGTPFNLRPMKIGEDWLDSRHPDWLSIASSRWNGYVRDRAMGIGPHVMPFTFEFGASAHQLIERRNAATDSLALSEAKLENQATLRIIRNPITGVIEGFTGVNGGSTPINLVYHNPANPGGPLLSVVSTTTFYDFREQKYVSSIDIDLSRMRQSMQTEPIVPANGLLYVSNTELVSGTTGVVRVINGSRLPVSASAPSFSIATDRPLYIKGDYNSVWGSANEAERPVSMLAGDALTVLSNVWIDNYNPSSNPSVSTRKASATSLGAVSITGNVPSGSEDATPVAGRPTYFFSGGLENYFRFLEDWSGVDHKFKGSMVCLYKSATHRARWLNNGNIYSPPNRNWSWDTNLATKEPVGIPYMVAFGVSRRHVGDFDSSECTDLSDFLYLLDHWQGDGPTCDGPIDLPDFLAVLSYWGEGTGCH